MVSSLAAQLAQGASLNSALLVDKSRRKPTESYLFTPKEAHQHDLDSIYALGSNGFTQLATLEPSLRSYDNSLFSDQARALDITLQPAEVVAKLNETLNAFLPLLGPYLLENPTGRVMEWLVRRFRYVFGTFCVVLGLTISLLPTEFTNSMSTPYCHCSYHITSLPISPKCSQPCTSRT